jgi:hypothetical protein
MIATIIENCDTLYLFPEDTIHAIIDNLQSIYPTIYGVHGDLSELQKCVNGEDTRVIITMTDYLGLKKRGVIPSVYVYHWIDGTDLGYLDSLVKIGQHTDTYFEGSIRTQFGHVFCTNCKYRVNGLEIGSTLFYEGFNKPFDYGLKKENRRRPKLVKQCPVCGTFYRISIAKLL